MKIESIETTENESKIICSGYLENIYELQNHLNKNGLIYMAYLYDFTKNTKTRPYWDIIHDIDFIKFMFENNTILIEYLGREGRYYE